MRGKSAKHQVMIIRFEVCFCVIGRSLVEEGEQVTHHHQRRPRDAQQDLTDALRPLVHVLDSCRKTQTSERPRSVSEMSRAATQRHTLKKPPGGATEREKQQPALCLCCRGDELQTDTETQKTNKDRNRVRGLRRSRLRFHIREKKQNEVFQEVKR